MEDEKNVALVLGYGVYLDETYRQHLDMVAESADEFEYIILSGGFTSQELPELSEADIMAEYLGAKTSVKLVEENRAFTTSENLINAKPIILEIQYRESALFRAQGREITKLKITVFAKRPWWLKVRLLSWLLLRLPKARIKVRGTAPATSYKEYIKHTLVGVPVDVLAVFIPAVHKYKLKQRQGS